MPCSRLAAADRAEPHPVSMAVTDELRRSRLLAFFRLPIALPHIVWVVLWERARDVRCRPGMAVRARHRPRPRPFHRFLARYVRYIAHLNAFFLLVGNPFPGFVGEPGSYPVDLELPDSGAAEARRHVLPGFLAFPALLISGPLYAALWTATILGWFVALFLGRLPTRVPQPRHLHGALRGQVSAYLYLLTRPLPGLRPSGRSLVSVVGQGVMVQPHVVGLLVLPALSVAFVLKVCGPVARFL